MFPFELPVYSKRSKQSWKYTSKKPCKSSERWIIQDWVHLRYYGTWRCWGPVTSFKIADILAVVLDFTENADLCCRSIIISDSLDTKRGMNEIGIIYGEFKKSLVR